MLLWLILCLLSVASLGRRGRVGGRTAERKGGEGVYLWAGPRDNEHEMGQVLTTSGLL